MPILHRPRIPGRTVKWCASYPGLPVPHICPEAPPAVRKESLILLAFLKSPVCTLVLTTLIITARSQHCAVFLLAASNVVGRNYCIINDLKNLLDIRYLIVDSISNAFIAGG